MTVLVFIVRQLFAPRHEKHGGLMRAPGKLLATSILTLLIAVTALTAEKLTYENATLAKSSPSKPGNSPATSYNQPNFIRGNYNCYLRIYVVEPESRWVDYTDTYHYDFGFLGFGIDSALSIPYQDTLELTRTWNVNQSIYVDDISSSNIQVIAVLFNAEDGGTGLSDPLYMEDPLGAPFTIHHVDASAAATPGNPGSDISDGSSTHSVFIEESTSKACPNCPIPRAALKSLYESGGYNFHYAAMLTEQGAYNYLKDNYNLKFVPTLYFDGGGEILLGGVSQIDQYTSRILACGAREVPDLDLAVSMSYTGDYEIEFTVTIVNNQFSNSAPDVPSAPSGPSAGLLEDEHMFTTSTIDHESDQIYYMWDWGNEQSGWLGPYNSGETVEGYHTWSAEDTYNVRVKVKDATELESNWSEVSPFKVVARGNANGDSLINIGDVVYLVNYIFREGPPPEPVSAGDASCNGFTDIGDAVYLMAYTFRGGPPPGCP
jgi:hypothetical protein